MGGQFHGRTDRAGTLAGVGDPPDVEMTDVALEVLEAADALVLGPQHCEEGRPAFILVRRIRGLGLILPEQPQMLVRADLLQVGGHGRAECGAAQRVVRPSGEPAPDRAVHLHGSLGEDVSGRDPVQGQADYLCVGRHG